MRQAATSGFFREQANPAQVEAEMAELRAHDARWSDRRNLRASYFAGTDVVEVATRAFVSCFGANALYGALAYPSLRRYESDVVDTLLDLFRAPEGATGTITTGGTESIFLAVKAARDRARQQRPTPKPNLVIPRTGHAAFDKAADLMGIEVRRMETSPGLRADVAGMARAVDDDTILIVGSAPPYAYGIVDPLAEIGAIAAARRIWMHVDLCVGGMVLPFARDLGHVLPPFDFELPPVTSVSIDLHKYGYAFHGCSALLLRDEALLDYQRYRFDRWPVGSYTTAGFAGSRSGGPIASAWAVMRYLGYAGYRDRVERLFAAKDRLLAAVERTDGLVVHGRPDGPNCSFGSPTLDIGLVANVLAERGWSFARQVDPPGILVLLNAFHGEVIDAFAADLADAVSLVRSGRVAPDERPAVYTV